MDINTVNTHTSINTSTMNTHLAFDTHIGNTPLVMDTQIVNTGILNSEQENSLVCKYCKKKYSSKTYFQIHMEKIHPEYVKENDIRKKEYEKISVYCENSSEIVKYTCNSCEKTCSKEASMKYHVQERHTNPIILKCSVCYKQFNRKYNLKIHTEKNICVSPNNTLQIKEESSSIDQIDQNSTQVQEQIHNVKPNKSMQCHICNKMLSRKGTYDDHMEKFHSVPRKQRTKFKCCISECQDSFINLKKLRTHLIGGHNLALEKEELYFDSIKDFDRWKDRVEYFSPVKFIKKQKGTKNINGSLSQVFYCKRSGKYVNRGTGKRLKREGTCKMGSYCPATISVYVSSDGKVQCIYNKTHAGHKLYGRKNIKHTPMHNFNKEKIVGGAGSHFVIKHSGTEKFVHVLNNTISCNDSPLVFNKGVHDKMIFTFEVSKDDDEYGYIQHVASGKYVHPFGGSTEPELNTPLVIHDDKHNGCLFNMDQETNLIKHIGGLHVNPALHHTHPRKNVWLVLHEDTSDRSQFEFCDPSNTDREVEIPCDSDSGED